MRIAGEVLSCYLDNGGMGDPGHDPILFLELKHAFVVIRSNAFDAL